MAGVKSVLSKIPCWLISNSFWINSIPVVTVLVINLTPVPIAPKAERPTGSSDGSPIHPSLMFKVTFTKKRFCSTVFPLSSNTRHSAELGVGIGTGGLGFALLEAVLLDDTVDVTEVVGVCETEGVTIFLLAVGEFEGVVEFDIHGVDEVVNEELGIKDMVGDGVGETEVSNGARVCDSEYVALTVGVGLRVPDGLKLGEEAKLSDIDGGGLKNEADGLEDNDEIEVVG